MPSHKPLTKAMRAALGILFGCEEYDNGWGVVSASTTTVDGGQAWVHWRTAIALWRRGLVEGEHDLPPDEWPEEPTIRLTEAGREAIRA